MGVALNIRKVMPGFDLDIVFSTDSDMVVIHGPSGAGKSLTLRMIAGLTRPDQGKIEVNGRVLFDSETGVNLPVHHRNIGYLFQDYALFTHLTVEKNISFGLRKGILGRISNTGRENLESLLQNFGLEEVADKRVSEISGGQRQRVALARALAPDPGMLLLDEPFSALDQELRRQMRKEVKAVQRHFKIPLLLVTHDVADVQDLADEIVILRDGRVDRTWSLRNICRRRKVAHFVSDHGIPAAGGSGNP